MTLSSKTILIVDDDPDSIAATSIVLETLGYRIVSVTDPEQVIRTVKSQKPSLLILDVMMISETDGIHLAKALKDDPATADIPILMMTSIGKKRDFVFDPEKDKDYLPVEDFLEKPAPPEELKRHVQALIGSC